MRRDHIAELLPEIYRASLPAGGPLAALLEVMEAMHAPVEAVLDDLDAYLDPRRAPDRFVPYLAGWLDLDRYLDWPGGRRGSAPPRFAPGLGRLRELTAQAASLARVRGTRAGLQRMLEVATGLAGYVLTEAPPGEDGPRPFHLHVSAPAGARRFTDLVRRIVEDEKPAYVTYELEFEEAVAPGG